MNFYNKLRELCMLSAGTLLLVFGINGSVLAECIGDINATGTILVDATTSCEAIGQDGCRIDDFTPGNNCCTIPDSDGTEVCAQFTTEGDKTSGVQWSITAGPDNVNWFLVGGATQGGACGNIWDPGVREPSPGSVFGFRKSNGSLQSVTYVEACTKHEVPAAQLRLNKRVVAEDPDTAGLFDCTKAVKSLDVETADSVKVKYCYTITNRGAAAYASVTLTDDMGTPSDTSDDLPLTDLGPLAVNGSIDYTSPAPVVYSRPGTIVNTAIAAGTDSNNEWAQDDDTATVNIELLPVECDVLTVVDSNGNQIQNQYLLFHGISPLKPSAPAVCVRTGDDNTFPRARRNRCVDDCTLKPECVNPATGTTGPGGICEQPCLPSGAWTEHDTAANGYACLGRPQNVPGNLYPYCWEVAQDLDRNCLLNAVHPISGQESYGEQISTNPYVYKSCTKQGGRKVCEVYCYLYDGEDAAVCPDTATVVPPQ